MFAYLPKNITANSQAYCLNILNSDMKLNYTTQLQYKKGFETNSKKIYIKMSPMLFNGPCF